MFCMTSGSPSNHLIFYRLILRVLQCQETFFSGTDLYNIFNIILEKLAVAHLSGVEDGFGRIDDFLDGDQAYDDLYLDLRQEAHIHGNTAVVGAGAFLYAASHHIGYGDAGYSDLVHRLHEVVQFVLPCDDDELRKLMYLSIGGAGFRRGQAFVVCRSVRLWLFGVGMDSRRSRDHPVLCVCAEYIRHAAKCILSEESGIAACKAVFLYIKACNLFFLRNPESDGMLDDLEDDDHSYGNPCGCGDKAKELYIEQMESAACEKTLPFRAGSVREKTYTESSQCAVHTMDAYGAHRIVDLAYLIDELDAEDYGKAGDYADDSRRKRRYRVAACRDCNQSGERTIQSHGYVRFLITDPSDEHDGDGGCGSGEVCGHEDLAGCHDCFPFHGDRRGSVKTEPAEPEDKDAQGADGQVMSGDGSGFPALTVFAKTRS